MENFKHLPEPFRIRVVEPVKRTTRAYREQAILRHFTARLKEVEISEKKAGKKNEQTLEEAF